MLGNVTVMIRQVRDDFLHPDVRPTLFDTHRLGAASECILRDILDEMSNETLRCASRLKGAVTRGSVRASAAYVAGNALSRLL